MDPASRHILKPKTYLTPALPNLQNPPPPKNAMSEEVTVAAQPAFTPRVQTNPITVLSHPSNEGKVKRAVNDTWEGNSFKSARGEEIDVLSQLFHKNLPPLSTTVKTIDPSILTIEELYDALENVGVRVPNVEMRYFPNTTHFRVSGRDALNPEEQKLLNHWIKTTFANPKQFSDPKWPLYNPVYFKKALPVLHLLNPQTIGKIFGALYDVDRPGEEPYDEAILDDEDNKRNFIPYLASFSTAQILAFAESGKGRYLHDVSMLEALEPSLSQACLDEKKRILMFSQSDWGGSTPLHNEEVLARMLTQLNKMSLYLFSATSLIKMFSVQDEYSSESVFEMHPEIFREYLPPQHPVIVHLDALKFSTKESA